MDFAIVIAKSLEPPVSSSLTSQPFFVWGKEKCLVTLAKFYELEECN